MDPIAQTYKFLDEREEKRFAGWKPRPPRFNPSSIDKCSRQLWYGHVGTTPDGPVPGFLSQYGPSGDFYHDQVRFEMRDAGVEMRGLRFNDATRTVDELDIIKKEIIHKDQSIVLSGRGDGRVLVDGEECYLELKSVDAGKYRWMEKAYRDGTILDYLRKKYPSYFSQSNMMMSPEMLDLPKTYLVIVNRSNCQFGFSDANYENREGGVLFDFDPEMWEAQKNKMAFITKARLGDKAPAREKVEGSIDCKRCPFEARCWGAS